MIGLSKELMREPVAFAALKEVKTPDCLQGPGARTALIKVNALPGTTNCRVITNYREDGQEYRVTQDYDVLHETGEIVPCQDHELNRELRITKRMPSKRAEPKPSLAV